MTSPKRLVDEGTSLDRTLLRAAREDRPAPDFERRVIAAALAPTTVAPPLHSPSRLARLARLARPGLIVVAIGAGAAMVGRRGADRPPATAPSVAVAQSTPVPAPPAAAAATSIPVEDEPIAVTTPQRAPLPGVAAPVVASAPRGSGAPSTPPPVVDTAAKRALPSLGREVELLDTVKQRLKAGSPAEAERALDAYDDEFPQGTLKPESSVLRIRLLLASGQRARAIALTDEVLRRDPNSVHAKRMRALLAADGAEP